MQILPNHFPRSRREKAGLPGRSEGQVVPRAIPHPLLDWKYLRPPSRKFPFFQSAISFPFDSSPEASASILADLCLLAYDEPGFFQKFLPSSGLRFVDFIRNKGIEVYVVQSPSSKIVIFRGTQVNNPVELYKDLKTDLTFLPQKSSHYSGKIHNGFEKALEQVWSPLWPHLREDSPVIFTGHSLGGALALLAGFRTGRTGTPVYTFACPRVGDSAFATAASRKLDWNRYEMEHDLVPRLPPRKFGFAHSGKRHVIHRNGQITVKPEPKRDKAWNDSLKLNLFDHSPVLYATHLHNAMLNNK